MIIELFASQITLIAFSLTKLISINLNLEKILKFRVFFLYLYLTFLTINISYFRFSLLNN